jgi:hypothetical protein
VLPLTFSVLLAVYLIIPEAIFRVTSGFFIPTKVLTLTRIEKAFRAVLLAVIPFLLGLGASLYVPGPDRWPWPIPLDQNSVEKKQADYKLVASDLYSESEFGATKDRFWPALSRSVHRQARLASWYYVFVALEGLLIGSLVSQYDKFHTNQLYRRFADIVLSPYISHWYLLLTPQNAKVQADILCANGLLYQGIISQYFLKEGDLLGVILVQPRRFSREPFHKAKGEGQSPEKKDYWVSIPSKHMYFFAEKILNMNLTYLTASPQITDSAALKNFLTAEFGSLKVSVNTEQKAQSGPDVKAASPNVQTVRGV